MRKLFYDLLIDGKPVLVPDSDMVVELSDMEHSDSGRDEMGYQHRIVLRRNVKTLTLPYGILDAEEYRYMESLFGGKDTVVITCKGLGAKIISFKAYRSKYSITVRDVATGKFRNYKIQLIEC